MTTSADNREYKHLNIFVIGTGKIENDLFYERVNSFLISKHHKYILGDVKIHFPTKSDKITKENCDLLIVWNKSQIYYNHIKSHIRQASINSIPMKFIVQPARIL